MRTRGKKSGCARAQQHHACLVSLCRGCSMTRVCAQQQQDVTSGERCKAHAQRNQDGEDSTANPHAVCFRGLYQYIIHVVHCGHTVSSQQPSSRGGGLLGDCKINTRG